MLLVLTNIFSPLNKQVKEIQEDLEKLSPHKIKHTKKVRFIRVKLKVPGKKVGLHQNFI